MLRRTGRASAARGGSIGAVDVIQQDLPAYPENAKRDEAHDEKPSFGASNATAAVRTCGLWISSAEGACR